MIRSCIGIYGDNVANDGSDMVNDISVDTVGEVSAASMFNKNSFIDAVMSMGDRFDELAAIMVHPVVYATLRKSDDAEDVYDADGRFLFTSYMNHRLIIEENATLVTDASGTASGDTPDYYLSILFGQGAFAYGQSLPRNAMEMDRYILQGNGGGTEVIVERQNWIIHPMGYDFNSSSISGQSASWAELDNAVEWNRKVARKNIPLAFLRTNG